jgi:hypothetical protein
MSPAKAEMKTLRILIADDHDVAVGTDQRDLEFDFQGADFNGDEKSAVYLLCEFPNGDRNSFCHPTLTKYFVDSTAKNC